MHNQGTTMTLQANKEIPLSGIELAEKILARVNEILLETGEFSMTVLAPCLFDGRGSSAFHCKLNFIPNAQEHKSLPDIHRRVVWVPMDREEANRNMYFVTFGLYDERLDPNTLEITSFSYSSNRVRHEWSTDDAAKHIYEYLSTQMLDGSKFK